MQFSLYILGSLHSLSGDDECGVCLSVIFSKRQHFLMGMIVFLSILTVASAERHLYVWSLCEDTILLLYSLAVMTTVVFPSSTTRLVVSLSFNSDSSESCLILEVFFFCGLRMPQDMTGFLQLLFQLSPLEDVQLQFTLWCSLLFWIAGSQHE